MTQQLITNTPFNSGQGDRLAVAFTKVNANFTELYSQQVFVPASPVNGTTIAAAALAASVNGGGIVRLPPGTISLVSYGQPLPMFNGVYYEGSGWGLDDSGNLYGTVLVGNNTFDCFAYNNVPTLTPPVSQQAYLAGKLHGAGIRNIGMQNFTYGIHIGEYFKPGMVGCTFENLATANCGWGFWFDNFSQCIFNNLNSIVSTVGLGWLGCANNGVWIEGNSTARMLYGSVGVTNPQNIQGWVINARGFSVINDVNIYSLQANKIPSVLVVAPCTAAGTTITVPDTTKFAVNQPVLLSGFSTYPTGVNCAGCASGSGGGINVKTNGSLGQQICFVTRIISPTTLSIATLQTDTNQTFTNSTVAASTRVVTTNGTTTVAIAGTSFNDYNNSAIINISGLPAGNGNYYVVNNPGSGTWNLATTPGGAAVSFTAGTGVANPCIYTMGFPHLTVAGYQYSGGNAGTIQPLCVQDCDLENSGTCCLLVQNSASGIKVKTNYVGPTPPQFVGYQSFASFRSAGFTYIEAGSTATAISFDSDLSSALVQMVGSVGRPSLWYGFAVPGSQNGPGGLAIVAGDPTGRLQVSNSMMLSLSGQAAPELAWNNQSFLEFPSAIGSPAQLLGDGASINIVNGHSSHVAYTGAGGAGLTLPTIAAKGEGIWLYIVNTTGNSCVITSAGAQKIYNGDLAGSAVATTFTIAAHKNAILIASTDNFNGSGNLFWSRFV